MKNLIVLLLIGFLPFTTYAQNEKPIWDIGTKWIYELTEYGVRTTGLTVEIIDTVTINGLKLYEIESRPIESGITHFYYDNGKVYDYDMDYDYLSLLYDFSQDTDYNTDYRPICDPGFDDNAENTKNYKIEIASTSDYQMPDNSIRKSQNAIVMDTSIYEGNISFYTESRQILDGIGFIAGRGINTHDWTFGSYVCGNPFSYVSRLRCFSSGSESYNFMDYDCDSTWLVSSIETPSLSEEEFTIYPNPTLSGVSHTYHKPLYYEVYNAQGIKINSGISSENGHIDLNKSGFLTVKLWINDRWHTRKIIRQ